MHQFAGIQSYINYDEKYVTVKRPNANDKSNLMTVKTEVDEWGLVVLFYAFSIAKVWKKSLECHQIPTIVHGFCLFGFYKLRFND